MNLRNRRSLCQTGILTLSLLLGTQPLWAGSSDDNNRPGAGEMVADLLVARPLLIGMTVVGSGLFIVSLPFSALGGNVGEAADQLVAGPARNAFVRCLGCTSASRKPAPASDGSTPQ